MATEEFQECFVESIGNKTLPDLPVELIGEIASHLDSASLHNLRNTTKWLATAVEHHYIKRHPTHTSCRDAKQLPGFIKQLTMPAIYTHINRLELTGGMSATAYPAFPSMFWLPRLSELVLVDIEMDGVPLLNMCIYHRPVLRSLSIHNVYLESLWCWETLLFAIMRQLKLDVLRAKGLSYKSDFTGFQSRINLPLEGRILGLEGAEGIKGSGEIKQLMDVYFVDRNKWEFRREAAQIACIMRKAKSVRVLQARGLHTTTQTCNTPALFIS